jgi:hypothetical protein
MWLSEEVVDELTAERGEEAREATLQPVDSRVYRIVDGNCWIHRSSENDATRGYFFQTNEAGVIRSQAWDLCVLEMVETGEVSEVRLGETFAGGWHYLRYQRKVTDRKTSLEVQ